MLHDVNCPKCSHQFPVTQARHAIGVDCPRCQAGFTVDFKKRPGPVEPGMPPYEVAVRPGKPVNSNNAGDELPKKKRREEDDDDAAPASGGSSVLVVFAAVGSMLLAASGLAVTGYFLYTNMDSAPEVVNRNNNKPATSSTDGTKPQTNKSDSVNSGGNAGTASPRKNEPFNLNPVAGRIPEIHPASLPAESSTIKLPSRVGAVAIGGGGRYIIMHFPDRGMFGVFDASTGLITATETYRGDVKIAAGLSRIVLLTPGNNTLHVYDIPEPATDGNKLRLVKLYDSPAPVNDIRSIAMGSRTNGPLMGVSHSGGIHVLDMKADGIDEVEEGRKDNLGLFSGNVRVLPTGKGVTTFDILGRNGKVRVANVENHLWKKKDFGPSPFPGQDDRLYGPGRIVDLNGKNQFDVAEEKSAGWLIPAASGMSGAFVQVLPSSPSGGGKRSVTVTIHNRGDSRRPVTGAPVLTGLPEFDGLFDGSGNPVFDQPLDQRFFLFPEANLLAIISGSKDLLLLRRVEMR